MCVGGSALPLAVAVGFGAQGPATGSASGSASGSAALACTGTAWPRLGVMWATQLTLLTISMGEKQKDQAQSAESAEADSWLTRSQLSCWQRAVEPLFRSGVPYLQYPLGRYNRRFWETYFFIPEKEKTPSKNDFPFSP